MRKAKLKKIESSKVLIILIFIIKKNRILTTVFSICFLFLLSFEMPNIDQELWICSLLFLPLFSDILNLLFFDLFYGFYFLSTKIDCDITFILFNSI